MWKVFATAAGVASMLVVGFAATPQNRSGGPAPSDDGRTLFLTFCSSCHGPTGHGDGPVAESFSVRPTDLTLLAKSTDGAFIADRIERMIDGRDRYVKAHGSIEMPVWGDAFRRRDGLSEEGIKARIKAIVRYLQSIQQRLG